jgi:two-component system sensor histidine kinase/response regulator
MGREYRCCQRWPFGVNHKEGDRTVIETLLEHQRVDRVAAIPILIIDDEPSVREGLQEFLEDEGYDVYLARNGREGLKIFDEVRPDLVLTDLRMPGIPGVEVIQQIKAANPQAVVIVITGYGSLDAALAAIRLSVFDFIGKPIDLDHLKESLENACHGLSARRNIQHELEAQRDQLALARLCLDEYQVKMAEVESLALAGQHLAGILHNLISPLSYIMGQAQMLRMLYPEVDRLEKIENQAVRMEKIISTILAKLKHSQSRGKELLQLNEILREEVLFLEAYPFFKHEVSTCLDLAPDLPEFEGIAADFSQLFGNLLRNAVEALQGQPLRQLTITSRHKEHEICISVHDSGAGIPEHLHERVFQPFYSTKTNKEGIAGSSGTGLGLYSCRQLVLQYAGYIEVKSRLGEGTSFIVHFPRTRKKPS